MKSLKKDYGKEYIYKGVYIYQITKKDYCVFNENGVIVDESTLKAAKEKIDAAILNELTEIAKKNSYTIERRGDLETRRSDEEDFQEIAIWDLKDMLIAAYELGLNSKIEK